MKKSTIGFFIVFLASILLVQNAEASWFDEITKNLNRNNGYNSWQNNNWQQKLQYDIENTKRDLDNKWNSKWKYDVDNANRQFQYDVENTKRNLDNEWNTKWKYEVDSANRDLQYKVENTKRDLDNQWNNKWKYEVDAANRDLQYKVENTKRELDYQWQTQHQPKIDQLRAEQEVAWQNYDEDAADTMSDSLNHSVTDVFTDENERQELYKNQDIVTESSILLLKVMPVYDGETKKITTFDKGFRKVVNAALPNARGSDVSKDPTRVLILAAAKADYPLQAKIIQVPDGSWISVEDAAEIGYKNSQVKEAKVAFGAMKIAINADDPAKFEQNLQRFSEIIDDINMNQESVKSYELKKSNSPFSSVLSPIYNTVDKPHNSEYVPLSKRLEQARQGSHASDSALEYDYGNRGTDLVKSTRPVTTTVHVVYINEGASSQGCTQNDSCLSQSYLQINWQEKVEWRNADDTAHAISGSGAGKFSSGMLGPGKDYSRKFNNYGQFDYVCMIHPWISGRVIVSA